MIAPLEIGVLGDGFMQPASYRKALEARMPGRAFEIFEAVTGWPLEGPSTKYDPTLPIGKFVSRRAECSPFLKGLDILITHLARITSESINQALGLKIAPCHAGDRSISTSPLPRCEG